MVGFTCQIGSRTIRGVVKEKAKAKEVYDEAISRGEAAGLLAQGPTSDVFSSWLGNIPAGEKVLVEITYVGELKHDMAADGIRFTLPTKISPRYGDVSMARVNESPNTTTATKGIKVVVDVSLDKGSSIRELRSPSHPIAVAIGHTSNGEVESLLSRASATLSLGVSQLDRDFVLEIIHRDIAPPRALLEIHPTIPGQRALMMTLVPNFAVQQSRPEIIFVADRSGSMQSKIITLISAIKIFLKSLPVGLPFNICSYGSTHSFLWPKSQPYSEESLAKAIRHVGKFDANYGGTETLSAIRAAIESRIEDHELSVILCTDGDIWQQQELFSYLNEQISRSKQSIHVFPLGIGNAVSHALIEGVARAGNGFAQTVGENEKLDGKVVRMLGGAMTPAVTDYTMEVRYDAIEEEDDGFVLVEKVTDSLHGMRVDDVKTMGVGKDRIAPTHTTGEDGQARYNHLPVIGAPKLFQAPFKLPPLYSFARTTVYLLLSPKASHGTPTVVVLKGKTSQGPVELEIQVEMLPRSGETIHQLAAKKAVGELEEGRGWIFHATDEDGLFIKDRFGEVFDQLVEREAVRLGVQYQVGGKWCSFVAVEGNKMTVQPLVNDQPLVETRTPTATRQICFQQQSSQRRQRLQQQSYGVKISPITRDRFTSPSSGALQLTTPSGSPLLSTTRVAATPVNVGYSAPLFIPAAAPYRGLPRRSTGGSPPRKQFAAMARSKAVPFTPVPSPGTKFHPDVEGEVDEDGSMSDAEDQPASDPDPDPLHALISLQSFDGSWPLAPLLALLKLTSNQTPTNPPGMKSNELQEERIWATILAIRYLKTKLAREKEAWELLVQKAEGWLDGVCDGARQAREQWDGVAGELVGGI